jgi:hypothetical protein
MFISRSPQRRTARRLALVSVAALGVLAHSAPAVASSHTIVVRSGESIQTALDAARPGDRVVVSTGVYTEQLLLTTERVSLIGNGAVLRPPQVFSPNICSGLAGQVSPGVDTEVGICVAGRGVVLGPLVNQEHHRVISVERRVRGVTISGFRVEGFSGANVAFVAASDALLTDNVLVDGDHYGALTVGSTQTRFTRNVVATNGDLHGIGVCTDDVTPVTVDHNDVSGYVVGFCVQTQGADFRNNVAHDNCIGFFVDPGIGAVVRDNRISSNNYAPCKDFFVTGVAVYLQGTHGTVVRGNRIEGHVPAGVLPAAALVITDSGAAAPASDNTVRNNRFDDNTLDVLVDSTGTGNTVIHNHCATSQPAGLCN